MFKTIEIGGNSEIEPREGTSNCWKCIVGRGLWDSGVFLFSSHPVQEMDSFAPPRILCYDALPRNNGATESKTVSQNDLASL